ncbi:MAG: serine/threonine protein kinase, partial [Desulfobulbaceae bacterium]|nr:serine/threonine protein kinase [Desulfobulbaceae bacterium]
MFKHERGKRERKRTRQIRQKEILQKKCCLIASSSPRHRYRFEREVKLAASLHHPNIVAIHDSGIAQGQYYYVMKYIEGKPLDEYVESNNLSLREIMQLFGKVCSASAYAHQKGVMHRDIKPGNVIVDNDGEPHILDFGLAKMVNGTDCQPETFVASIQGQVIGTLAFMSPEQATGNQDTVDIRTDVYSIGVMLYKVLTGQYPYDIDNAMLETLKNIQQVDPIRPSKVADGMNSEIDAIVMKSLEKDPNRRYQSAAHFQDDIDCWLNGLPVTARADSSLYILRKLMIRHRQATMVAGLLLVIILSFSFISFDLFLTAEKARRKAESLLGQVQIEKTSELLIAEQWTFYVFMDAWRIDDSKQVQAAAYFLPEGTRENTAMKFLIDSRQIDEKEKDFRDQLPNEHQWFAEFIIAEHYLKNGDSKKAFEHYQLSMAGARGLPDDKTNPCRWHAKEMKARLYELTVSG